MNTHDLPMGKQPASAVEQDAVVTIEATRGLPLSQRLRQVSHLGHQTEEPEHHFAMAFMRGGLTSEGLSAQFSQYYLIYEALESAARTHRTKHNDFAFWLPELHRLPSVIRDLEYWLGSQWERQIYDRFATPGVMTYVERVREVTPISLIHLLAHQYTRYFADLSGGQMIGKLFRENYPTDGESGSQFFTFNQIPDPDAYKDFYRTKLDALELEEADQVILLKEVAVAYWLNGVANRDLEDLYEQYRA